MVLPDSPVLPPGASRGRRAPLTIPACLRLNGCFRKSSTAGAGKKNSLRSNSFFPDRPVCTVFPGRSESAQVVVPTSGPHYFLNAFRAKQCKSQAFSLCRRAACAHSYIPQCSGIHKHSGWTRRDVAATAIKPKKPPWPGSLTPLPRRLFQLRTQRY